MWYLISPNFLCSRDVHVPVGGGANQTFLYDRTDANRRPEDESSGYKMEGLCPISGMKYYVFGPTLWLAVDSNGAGLQNGLANTIMEKVSIEWSVNHD